MYGNRIFGFFANIYCCVMKLTASAPYPVYWKFPRDSNDDQIEKVKVQRDHISNNFLAYAMPRIRNILLFILV